MSIRRGNRGDRDLPPPLTVVVFWRYAVGAGPDERKGVGWLTCGSVLVASALRNSVAVPKTQLVSVTVVGVRLPFAAMFQAGDCVVVDPWWAGGDWTSARTCPLLVSMTSMSAGLQSPG